jgi:hypothetical protein
MELKVDSRAIKAPEVLADPPEETAHPPPFLLVILASRPNNKDLRDISPSVVPLGRLELQWVMMVEPKDLPM